MFALYWQTCVFEKKKIVITDCHFFCFSFVIYLDEFENVIKKTTFFNKITFNFDTEFVKTYFGADKTAHVRFDDFSHLLQVGSKDAVRGLTL